jgi:hypothetical protein
VQPSQRDYDLSSDLSAFYLANWSTRAIANRVQRQAARVISDLHAVIFGMPRQRLVVVLADPLRDVLRGRAVLAVRQLPRLLRLCPRCLLRSALARTVWNRFTF